MVTIETSSLGSQVELGSLYDATTGNYFSGYSLWKFEEIEKNQVIRSTPNTDLKISSSLDEARDNFGIDAESRLALNVKLFELKGSAKFLMENSSFTEEARVDIMCLKVNQTRRIPMETMVEMSYDKLVFKNCPNATHFVAEVVEGAFGNISLKKKCNSSEEVKTVVGSLSGLLKKMVCSIEAEAEAKVQTREDGKHENLQISVDGAIDDPIATLEDAVKVGRNLPKTLSTSYNTLKVTLLPVSILESTAGKAVRILDDFLINHVNRTTEDAKATARAIYGLQTMNHLEFYPSLQKQVNSFSAEFFSCFEDFCLSIRTVLPQLKLSSNADGPLMLELNKAVSHMTKQINITNNFISIKKREGGKILETFETMEELGFTNCVEDITLQKSLIKLESRTRVVLNLNGKQLNKKLHPLQNNLRNETWNDNEDEESDEEEWFDDISAINLLEHSVEELKSLKSRSIVGVKEDIVFTFGTISKALSNQGKRVTTRIGDIIIAKNGQHSIITGYLPKPPKALKLEVSKQTISASWITQDNSVLPSKAFLIRWRPKANPELDSFDNVYGDDEIWDQKELTPDKHEFLITEYLEGHLNSFTDYEVEIAAKTEVGFSEFSSKATARTWKKPSLASSLINFYLENEALCKTQTPSPLRSKLKPWEKENGRKPWELTNDTLFLGLKTVAVRRCSTADYKDEIAVLIVDVVPDYAPEIIPAQPETEDSRMIMFVGETGSGKSTQINAFVSYLCGGDLNDSHRILLVDDRNLDQSNSVTRYITVYRIRPLADSFHRKTFYIIDTPGYGDTESLETGLDRDKFITASMKVMFETLPKINTIVLACKSGETRATVGITAAVTNIFQLFANNVRQCLRTVLTFSDVGTSPAIKVLESLEWPVDSTKLVEVNNSAFRIADAETSNNPKVRSWWKLSMDGQHEVAKMLQMMEAVPTAPSAQVTHNRISLSETCTLVEKQVLKTANDTANLLTNLDSISNAIGASPGEKVKITVTEVEEQRVPDGKQTTLCLDCKYTCHKTCTIKDNSWKGWCHAMDWWGNCRICPKRCPWDKHENVGFILVPVRRTEWVVPDELIKKWNDTTNSLEGAAIDAMDEYIKLQNELKKHIDSLVEITEKLRNESLKHNPNALLNYLRTLVKTAEAQGATPEQLETLTAARNAMMVQTNVARGHLTGFNEPTLLAQIVGDVRKELKRRSNLSHHERAAEEEEPCNLYNNLRAKLPRELQDKAPPELEKFHKSRAHMFTSKFDTKGALFPENLKAIVQLLKLILKTGKVTAVHSDVIAS